MFQNPNCFPSNVYVFSDPCWSLKNLVHSSPRTIPFPWCSCHFSVGPLRVAGVMRHRFGAIVSNVAWWSSWRFWGPKVFGVWGHVENYVHSCWRFLKWIDEVGLKFWKSHLILMKVDHSNWVLNNWVFSGWKRDYLCLLFLMKECLLASLGIHGSIRLIGWTVGTLPSVGYLRLFVRMKCYPGVNGLPTGWMVKVYFKDVSTILVYWRILFQVILGGGNSRIFLLYVFASSWVNDYSNLTHGFFLKWLAKKNSIASYWYALEQFLVFPWFFIGPAEVLFANPWICVSSSAARET